MTKSELMQYLSSMPDDFEVIVNDNFGGRVFDIEQVDLFSIEGGDEDDNIVIQVNWV